MLSWICVFLLLLFLPLCFCQIMFDHVEISVSEDKILHQPWNTILCADHPTLSFHLHLLGLKQIKKSVQMCLNSLNPCLVTLAVQQHCFTSSHTPALHHCQTAVMWTSVVTDLSVLVLKNHTTFCSHLYVMCLTENCYPVFSAVLKNQSEGKFI